MKQKPLAAFVLLAVVLIASATVKSGESAPAFSATDSNGQSHKLTDFKGKFVVLEWTNSGCPFTVKHYASGNMQKLQKEWTGKGVVWLTVLSSAPGKQGFKTSAEENAYLKEVNATPTAVLMDPKGDLGHLFGAKTTPHMFVIDPNGKVIYEGAIDDKPSSSESDIASAKNYVSTALSEATAGKAVTTANSQAYGCSVKYEGGD